MADIEYGSLFSSSQLKNIDKNLSFKMNGQVGTDDNAKDVTVAGKVTTTLGTLTGSSSVSNNEQGALSASADSFDSSSTYTHEIKWTWKPNVATKGWIKQDYKISLKDSLGTSSNKISNKNGKTNDLRFTKPSYSKVTNRRDVRSSNATISISITKGATSLDDGGSCTIYTGTSPNRTSTYAVAQIGYNQEEPYSEITLSTSSDWIGFGNSLDNTKSAFGVSKDYKWDYDDSSKDESSHMYIYAKDNTPSVTFGTVSGKQTVSVSCSDPNLIDLKTNTLSMYGTGTNKLKFSSTNEGNAFVTTEPDRSNDTVPDRSGEVTYTFDVYNPTKESSTSGKFTIYQSGGKVDSPSPEITYNWTVSPDSFISNVSSSNGNYSFNVGDNSGKKGEIKGTLKIDDISAKYQGVSSALATTYALDVTYATNTSERYVYVTSDVGANYVSQNTIKNPSIKTTIKQNGSSWIDTPYADFTLTVKDIPGMDYSIPNKDTTANFELSKDGINWAKSINLTISNQNSSFYYRFANISPNNDSGGVSGTMKPNPSKKDDVNYTGETFDIEISEDSNNPLKFNTTSKPAVSDKSWTLTASKGTISSLIKDAGVQGFTKTITQTGRSADSTQTKDSATVSCNSDKSWCTVSGGDGTISETTKTKKWSITVDSNINNIDQFDISSSDTSISVSVPETTISGLSNTFASDDVNATLTLSNDKGISFDPSSISITRGKEPLNYTIELKTNDTDYVEIKNKSLTQTNKSSDIVLKDTGGSWTSHKTITEITKQNGEKMTVIPPEGGKYVIHRNSGLPAWSPGAEKKVSISVSVKSAPSGKNYLNINNSTTVNSKSGTIEYTLGGKKNDDNPTFNWKYQEATGDGKYSEWESISTSDEESIEYSFVSNAPNGDNLTEDHYPTVEINSTNSIFNNPFKYKLGSKKVSVNAKTIRFSLEDNAGWNNNGDITITQNGGEIKKNTVTFTVSGNKNCDATVESPVYATESWNYGGTVTINTGWGYISDWKNTSNNISISKKSGTGYHTGEATYSIFDDNTYKYRVNVNGLSNGSISITVNCGNISVTANNEYKDCGTVEKKDHKETITLTSDDTHKITSEITWDDNQYSGIYERSFKPSSYERSSSDQTITRKATVKVKCDGNEIFNDSLSFTWTIAKVVYYNA